MGAFYMRTFLRSFVPAFLILCLASGCGDTNNQAAINTKVAAFFGNKTTQQVLSGVMTIGLDAGVSAATQYAATGNVDSGAIVSGALNGAASVLRSLQSTPQAASPAAITAAITSGTGNSQVAASVTPSAVAAISQATAKGVAPDAANEQFAKALDAAAANPPAVLSGP